MILHGYDLDATSRLSESFQQLQRESAGKLGLAKLPARGPTADAIRYALNHWDGLERFLEDGRIELDNNSVERAMRPVCLSRKNSLFAGSDEGGENWACLASLIETCKLNSVNPQVYFTDVITRLVNGWPQNRIDELMPWLWANQRPP